jgi:hypothetical protein
MENTNDLHAVAGEAIEDHVSAIRKAPQTGQQILASTAKQRVDLQQPTIIFKAGNKPLSFGRIVRRDKVADLD